MLVTSPGLHKGHLVVLPGCRFTGGAPLFGGGLFFGGLSGGGVRFGTVARRGADGIGQFPVFGGPVGPEPEPPLGLVFEPPSGRFVPWLLPPPGRVPPPPVFAMGQPLGSRKISTVEPQRGSGSSVKYLAPEKGE